MKTVRIKKQMQDKQVPFKDLDTFRKNAASVSQLIAVVINNCPDVKRVPRLEQSLRDSVKFLDDMQFFFGRIAAAAE